VWHANGPNTDAGVVTNDARNRAVLALEHGLLSLAYACRVGVMWMHEELCLVLSAAAMAPARSS